MHRLILKPSILGCSILGILLASVPAGFSIGKINQARIEAEKKAVEVVRLKSEEEAKLAENFVKWWLGGAMDYSAATAEMHHREAAKWMTPEAAAKFDEEFWKPVKASKVTKLLCSLNGEYKSTKQEDVYAVTFPADFVALESDHPYLNLEVTVLIKRIDGNLRIVGHHTYNLNPQLAPADYFYAASPGLNLGLKEEAVKKFNFAFRTSDRKTAESFYGQAIEMCPKFAAAHFSRGFSRGCLGDKEGELSDYDAAIELIPGYVPAHVNKAVLLVEKKNRKGAIQEYDSALSYEPDSLPALSGRGIAYYELGDRDKALVDFNRVLKLDSSNVSAYCYRGLIFQDRGKIQESIYEFNNAIALDPASDYNLVVRGNSFFDLKNFETAIGDYSQAIKINANNFDAYNNRGLCYNRLRKSKEAINDYNHCLQINPKFVIALYNRAIERERINEFKSAISDLDRAIKLKPDFKQAYLVRATCNFSLKKFNEVTVDCDKAIALDPSDAFSYRTRARARRNLGDISGAMKDSEIAVKLEPENSFSFGTRSNCLADKEIDQKLKDINKAIELDLKYGGWYEDRAELEWKKGDYIAAAKDYCSQFICQHFKK